MPINHFVYSLFKAVSYSFSRTIHEPWRSKIHGSWIMRRRYFVVRGQLVSSLLPTALTKSLS